MNTPERIPQLRYACSAGFLVTTVSVAGVIAIWNPSAFIAATVKVQIVLFAILSAFAWRGIYLYLATTSLPSSERGPRGGIVPALALGPSLIALLDSGLLLAYGLLFPATPLLGRVFLSAQLLLVATGVLLGVFVALTARFARADGNRLPSAK